MTITYEDIVENLSEAVVGVDNDLNVVVFNQSAEKMTEVSRSLVVGRPADEVFARDARIVEMLRKTAVDGHLFAEYEEKLHRRFSGLLPVGITTSQVFDADGRAAGAVALIKDLSGIKSLEAATLRKERLAYIGQFAANLAHELKNPLSGMRGAAQLLSRRIKDEKLGEYTGVIMHEADRLNAIINEMLDFARPAKLNKKNLNIHRVLDSVILLMQEGGGPEGVAFARNYDPSLPPIHGDEGQLTQVFLNLVKNAKEASRAGGSIMLTTRITTDFHITTPGGAPGRTASIEIKDNGCGINEKNLDEIFTPFFTTKSRGTGLGMAISLKIIKEHDGHLKIASVPDKGTVVTVYLPTVEVSQ